MRAAAALALLQVSEALGLDELIVSQSLVGALQ